MHKIMQQEQANRPKAREKRRIDRCNRITIREIFFEKIIKLVKLKNKKKVLSQFGIISIYLFHLENQMDSDWK